MGKASSARIIIEDVSADRVAVGGAIRAPDATDLGFEPLGAVRWLVPLDKGPPAEITVTLYASRYGDAVAFAEPTDTDLRMRILSVLRSGRLVETRVPVGATASQRGRSADTMAVVPPPTEAGGGDPVSGFFDRVRQERLPMRYPDLPQLGMHRQVVNESDPDTLWLAHRGLLRRAQGNDDDVCDHRDTTVVCAALRRAVHVHETFEEGLQNAARRLSDILRNVLLAAPAALALGQGLTWYVAGMLVGAGGVGALLIRECVREPSWRSGLYAVPPLLLVVGWLTIGVLPLTALVLFGVLVVYARDLLFTDLVLKGLLWIGRDQLDPRPVPMPDMVEAYGA